MLRTDKSDMTKMFNPTMTINEAAKEVYNRVCACVTADHLGDKIDGIDLFCINLSHSYQKALKKAKHISHASRGEHYTPECETCIFLVDVLRHQNKMCCHGVCQEVFNLEVCVRCKDVVCKNHTHTIEGRLATSYDFLELPKPALYRVCQDCFFEI